MTVSFEDDQVIEFLERVAKGEAILQICKDSSMPSRSSVYAWEEADAKFAGQLRAARARGVHALAEECLQIADEKAADAVAVADKRVRIDTRLRLAGKWLPAVYGEKIDVKYSGEVTHRHDLSGYSPDELDALEKLIGKASDSTGDTGGASAPGADRVH